MTTITCYLSSCTEEPLSQFQGANFPQYCCAVDSSVFFENGFYLLQLLTIVENNLDLEDTINTIASNLSDLGIISYIKNNGQLSLRIKINVSESDADSNSLPAIDFSKEFITSLACTQPRIDIILKVTSSSTDENIGRSGVVYYIYPNKDEEELDIDTINMISGTQPSFVYRKGEPGRCKNVVDYNAWEVRINEDGVLPSNPIKALMNRIKSPIELGLLCKKHDLSSHINIYCYGIPNRTISFVLDPDFIAFCEQLDIQWCDLDLMA